MPRISQGRDVVVVTYGCHVISTDLSSGTSTSEPGCPAEGEVPGLVMPDGCKRPTAAWFTRLNGQAVP